MCQNVIFAPLQKFQNTSLLSNSGKRQYLANSFYHFVLQALKVFVAPVCDFASSTLYMQAHKCEPIFLYLFLDYDFVSFIYQPAAVGKAPILFL